MYNREWVESVTEIPPRNYHFPQINLLAAECKRIREEHGFVTDKDNIGEKLMLAVGELSEALEEVRAGHEPTEIYEGAGGKPEGFPIEIADTIIRLLDTSYSLGVDVADAIAIKMKFNEQREFRHGKKF